MTVALLITLGVLLIGALVLLWRERRRREWWQWQAVHNAAHLYAISRSKTAPAPEGHGEGLCRDVCHKGEWYQLTLESSSGPILGSIIDACRQEWGDGRLIWHEHGYAWIPEQP